MRTEVVATFRYRYEGELARQILAEAGIDSVLIADDLGGLRPDIMSANPIRIAVRWDEAERAREVLTSE
jgi:hypothetical protein